MICSMESGSRNDGRVIEIPRDREVIVYCVKGIQSADPLRIDSKKAVKIRLHCRLRFPINNPITELFSFGNQQSVERGMLNFTQLFKNGFACLPPNNIRNASGQQGRSFYESCSLVLRCLPKARECRIRLHQQALGVGSAQIPCQD